MKSFLVYFDEKVNGTLVEGCFRFTAKTKSEAIAKYRNVAPKNSIFRCVKVGC